VQDDSFRSGGPEVWVPLRSRGRLPHLEKPGGTYFVTFRLQDALGEPTRAPRSVDGIEPFDVARDHEPPLRAGSCVLARPDCAAVVRDALLHFDGERYVLSAFCVMPNHVHVVVTPARGQTIGAILHGWKSFTAHAVNRLLDRRGALWESEAFDHLVRSEAALRRFVEYTETNPVAAGLCAHPWEWPYSSAVRPSDGPERGS